jgi:hypothetical protein
MRTMGHCVPLELLACIPSSYYTLPCSIGGIACLHYIPQAYSLSSWLGIYMHPIQPNPRNEKFFCVLHMACHRRPAGISSLLLYGPHACAQLDHHRIGESIFDFHPHHTQGSSCLVSLSTPQYHYLLVQY